MRGLRAFVLKGETQKGEMGRVGHKNLNGLREGAESAACQTNVQDQATRLYEVI